MADDRSDPAKGGDPFVVATKPLAKPYGGYAFQNIKHEHGDCRPLTQNPKCIGCTGIAAAMLADIYPFKELGQHDAEAYGAEQITENDSYDL
ncbi:hypothetical protein PAJ34TS1_23610 [Paenibacillus azoreducens]